MGRLRIVQLTSDSREVIRDYGARTAGFGTAPEALLQGFALLPEVEVHVVSCLQQPVVTPEKLADNIWCHSLHVPKLGWMRTGYQGCIRAVRKKLRELQPDVVHGQGTERDCAISAVYSGFPNVVTIHGNMAEIARLLRHRPGSFGWLAARLETFTLKRTAGVFCNSAYTESLVRPRAQRVWRVANPIRAPFFFPAGSVARTDSCTLLNIGVISPRKRQLELLDLARELHGQGLKFELQFIGLASAETAYGRTFLERIGAAEKAGYARHLGSKSMEELIALYDRASGVVHFPGEEAFGLVVAEALARGVKLFGARVGGIVDIAGGVPGVELCDVEDWRGLGAALAGWMRAGFPQAPGGAALMRTRYQPEVIARRHLEIYREVLSNPS